ncbi:hypothetical protein J4463_01015 [Candidatus Pacearchaeota archaeon]|nr:hypothetical protein [Candidatus Pacearchaeota archaeon]
MAFETILMHAFAVQIIYPFLLIFTLVFAILQKSKILGDEKKQIDALVAFSIALITVAFSWATNIITSLMPFLAVSVVILLVFMILYGFVGSTSEKEFSLPKRVQVGIVIIAGIALIIAVLVATGQWDKVHNALFINGNPTNLFSNVLLIAIIAGALIIVVMPFKSSGGKKKDE